MKNVALALVAAIAAAGAGFLAYRQTHAPEPALQALPTARVGAVPGQPGTPGATPPAAAGEVEIAGSAPPPPIPEEVPALALADMAGKLRPLRGSEGRPRLFNFWATWCAPCRKEIPLLNTLAARYQGDRLEVVGIAIDFHDAVATFLQKVPMRYDTLIGEEDGLEAARRFGMGMALPFSVFADGQNRVVAVKLGELHEDEIEAILGRMRAARTGALALTEARAAIAEDLKALSVKRAQQSTTG
jgi:thiol-disulfide isomerase/thioredoxin